MRQENRALQARLSELETKVNGFEDQIQRNFELLDRANLVAGLAPLDSVTQQVGVGGYELPEDTTLSVMGPLTRERVADLQDNLEKLVRQARLQRQGYEKVLFALQESQYLRDCTPSIRPVSRGFLTSGYGRRIDPFTGQPAQHTGIDFSAPMGTPVRATANGTVVRASWWGTLGKVVEVSHGNGLSTRYGHLSSFQVQKGDVVQRGDLLGSVGSSGRSTAPHLHYEVVREGQPENPWAYLIPE
jgi:murein DD-endopeptidase MepM/ murein hydrolase activator NlpD